MAQHDLLKLASQGRAFDATRPWTEDELLAVEALVNHGLVRTVAAEYVRNGILTVKMYEAAQEAGFEPKSLESLRADAVAAHQKEVRAQLGLDDEAEAESEEVSETEEVVEPEAEAEEVAETEAAEEAAEEVVEPEAEAEEVAETEEVVEPEAEAEAPAPAKPEVKKSNSRGGKK